MTYRNFYFSHPVRTDISRFLDFAEMILGGLDNEDLQDVVGPPVNDDKVSADDLVKTILKSNVSDDEEFVIEVTKKKGEQAYVVIKDLEVEEEVPTAEDRDIPTSIPDVGVSVDDLRSDVFETIRRIAREEAEKARRSF